MNGVDIRRYEMLVRVRDFGAAHLDVFPLSSFGGQAFAAVDTAVTSLGEQAATQRSGRGSAREGTTSKAVAREALRDGLDAIARTARAMALEMPGLDDKFRTPRGSGDQSVLVAGRQFLRDAAPLAKRFVQHYMPETFLSDLESGVREFEEAIHEHQTGKHTHVAAGVAIDRAMEAGLNAVRRLDAIVPNQFRDDAVTLAVWEQSRRVEYKTGRTRTEPEAAAPTPEGPAEPATAAA